jgi:hypothetical protein
VTALHSRYVAGNLVYWDKHPKRIVSAIGPDVFSVFEDFTHVAVASDAVSNWTVTLVEAGGGESTVTRPDTAAGALLLTTDSNEDDGINMQITTGESFGPVATPSAIYFGVRFQASEATQIDLFAGLAITDTSLIGTSPSDAIYMDKVDGATAVTGTCAKNSTETDTAGTSVFAASAYTLWEFYYDGLAATPSVEFFVDGVSLGLVSGANVPDDELLCPSFAILAGSANVRTATIDYIRCIQIGR